MVSGGGGGDHPSTNTLSSSQGIIVVYDVTNLESFQHIPYWFKNIDEVRRRRCSLSSSVSLFGPLHSLLLSLCPCVCPVQFACSCRVPLHVHHLNLFEQLMSVTNLCGFLISLERQPQRHQDPSGEQVRRRLGAARRRQGTRGPTGGPVRGALLRVQLQAQHQHSADVCDTVRAHRRVPREECKQWWWWWW